MTRLFLSTVVWVDAFHFFDGRSCGKVGNAAVGSGGVFRFSISSKYAAIFFVDFADDEAVEVNAPLPVDWFEPDLLAGERLTKKNVAAVPSEHAVAGDSPEPRSVHRIAVLIVAAETILASRVDRGETVASS